MIENQHSSQIYAISHYVHSINISSSQSLLSFKWMTYFINQMVQICVRVYVFTLKTNLISHWNLILGFFLLFSFIDLIHVRFVVVAAAVVACGLHEINESNEGKVRTYSLFRSVVLISNKDSLYCRWWYTCNSNRITRNLDYRFPHLFHFHFYWQTQNANL